MLFFSSHWLDFGKPGYKLLTKPLELGDRVLFLRGKHKGETHVLVGIHPNSFFVTRRNLDEYLPHAYKGSINRIIVPIR